MILGKMFMAGGTTLRGAQQLGAPEFRNMLSAMETAIAKAGRAKPGDKTILDADGKGDIGSVLLTGFPIVKLYTEAYENEIKAKCPDCSVKRLTIETDGMSLAEALAHEHFRYPGWAPDHEQRIAAFTASKAKPSE